jgi:hypothetical protein
MKTAEAIRAAIRAVMLDECIEENAHEQPKQTCRECERITNLVFTAVVCALDEKQAE